MKRIIVKNMILTFGIFLAPIIIVITGIGTINDKKGGWWIYPIMYVVINVFISVIECCLRRKHL